MILLLLTSGPLSLVLRSGRFFCARRSSFLRRGVTEWISNNIGKGAAKLHGYTDAPNSGTAEVAMSVLVDGQRQCDPDVVMAEEGAVGQAVGT